MTNKIDTMEYLNRVVNLVHDYGTKQTTSTSTASTVSSNESNHLSDEESDI